MPPLHQNFGEIGESQNLKAEHHSQTQTVMLNSGDKLGSQRAHESNQNDNSESGHFRFSLPLLYLKYNTPTGFCQAHFGKKTN